MHKMYGLSSRMTLNVVKGFLRGILPIAPRRPEARSINALSQVYAKRQRPPQLAAAIQDGEGVAPHRIAVQALFFHYPTKPMSPSALTCGQQLPVSASISPLYLAHVIPVYFAAMAAMGRVIFRFRPRSERMASEAVVICHVPLAGMPVTAWVALVGSQPGRSSCLARTSRGAAGFPNFARRQCVVNPCRATTWLPSPGR